MSFLVRLPAVLASLLLAAHFLRAARLPLALGAALLPLLLVPRLRFTLRALQLLLLAGALEWARSLAVIARLRAVHGLPFGRMTAILGGVALFTAAAALLLQARRVRERHARGLESAGASVAAFLLTALMLAIVAAVVPRPLLLLERFLPGSAPLEIVALALYAGLVVERLSDPARVARWRTGVWLLFSLVFFAQLALGLLLDERFLMRAGHLHFPIPALIAAGPVYRGGELFMVMLFASTVLLVGPAWCSQICYLGAWDDLAARAKRKPFPLPRYRTHLRFGTLALVIAAALALRLAGASPLVAGAAALGFGLAGVAVMLLVSRRRGAMVHCLSFCPIGALATTLGRLSPFRVRIRSAGPSGDAGCDRCMRCRLACRFDALGREDVARGRPDPSSCTLCGDCLASCPGGFLEYRCLGLRAERARALFLMLVVALHAASLGLARI
jgi:ferredoxin